MAAGGLAAEILSVLLPIVCRSINLMLSDWQL